MEHIGIDLGMKHSAICIASEQGEVLAKEKVATRDLGSWFAKHARSRVVMESCAESWMVARLANESGHDAVVTPSSYGRTLSIGARGIKNDERDARALAVSSARLGEQLPRVHQKSAEAMEIKTLLNARQNMVESRTRMINFVRSQMRSQLLPRLKASSKGFAKKVRESYPGLAEKPATAAHLNVIDTLDREIEELEKKLEERTSEGVYSELRAITGVGPIVASAFVSAVDDAKRFSSPAHVASYFGVCPGENTTGFKIRRTSIIAAGQRSTRALLIQAAHSMLNSRRQEPMAVWARAIEARKGRRVAVVALARRLAVVMWAMLRDGTSYEPARTKPRRRSRSRSARSASTEAQLAAALTEKGAKKRAKPSSTVPKKGAEPSPTVPKKRAKPSSTVPKKGAKPSPTVTT